MIQILQRKIIQKEYHGTRNVKSKLVECCEITYERLLCHAKLAAIL